MGSGNECTNVEPKIEREILQLIPTLQFVPSVVTQCANATQPEGISGDARHTPSAKGQDKFDWENWGNTETERCRNGESVSR